MCATQREHLIACQWRRLRWHGAQDFDLPVECNASGELKAVHDYLERWESRDSWKKSYYTPEQVVEGWKKHMAS